MTAPILIMGMHRSGTSMMARLLEQMGVFMGRDKSANHEARFFHHINEWLLTQSGGSWDYPEPFLLLAAEAPVRRLAVKYIDHLLKTPYAIRYLGLSRYLRWRTPAKLPFAWGWKDPRLTYTLPVWLDLFPDLRLIYVVRHGVDVANSLVVRQQAMLRDAEKAMEERPYRYALSWPRMKRGGQFTNSLRCGVRDGAFSLWEAYMQEGRRQIALLGKQAMTVRYEEFVTDPLPHLQKIGRFCQLPAAEADITRMAQAINANRAYAYRSDPQLQQWSASLADRLAVWGYQE